jgi:hypothetical protein
MTWRIQSSWRRRGLVAVAASLLLAAGHSVGYEPERTKTAEAAEETPGRSTAVVVIHMTNVTGTIASVGDDAMAPPRAVGIVSPERRIYLIGDEGVGKDLKNLVGKTVTVAAEVKHDVDGWPYLAVEWYRVLKS